MPRSALQFVEVDLCVPLERIADELIKLIDSTVEPEPHAVPDRIPLENEFVSRGRLEMKELEKIATPSTLTCPECHGTLWEIEGAVPIRFRCHVGHAFTAQALADSQHEGVEDAIWAAVRALNEKETLLRRFARMASDQQKPDAAAEHERAADQATRSAKALLNIAVN